MVKIVRCSRRTFLVTAVIIATLIITLAASVVLMEIHSTGLEEKLKVADGNIQKEQAARQVYVEHLATLNEEVKKLREQEHTMMSRGNAARTPESLEDENKKLRETIAQISLSRGKDYVKKLPGKAPEDLSKYTFKKELGSWLVTYYAPSARECSNANGITASGKTAVPGYSVAIDPKYWKFGTKFYVEGFGIVEAHDTGSAIKGQQRMDICMLNSEVVAQLGARRQKVWLLEER